MKPNPFWHILGCLLPLVIVFLVPIFGLTGQTVTFIAVIAMFACHLLMIALVALNPFMRGISQSINTRSKRSD